MHANEQPASRYRSLLVIGLGYVGLPLAAEASRSGLRVTGLDQDPAICCRLSAGRSHVQDIADGELADMLATGFRAVAMEQDAGPHEVIVICVPTPLSADGTPDLSAVRSAAGTAGRLLRPGNLVVLESTTYPGTTDEIVRPILEKESGLTTGIDFYLAFSPERIDPGNQAFGLRNTPKIVGGVTPQCTSAATAFYEMICDQVVSAKSAREAEMAKLLENIYRHVNIALVNEIAMFCHEFGIDFRDSIRCAATKPFGFQPFYPGPGVGGHCIPVDPGYMSYKVRALGYPFRFAELAAEINGRMPRYVAGRVAALLNEHGKPVKGARVLLLGVTYKADVSDLRETPALPLARLLLARGANLAYFDPYAPSWTVDSTPVPSAASLSEALATADIVILLQAHTCYDLEVINQRSALLLDTRGVTRSGESL